MSLSRWGLILLCCMPGIGHGLSEVSWLYQVEQPVLANSASERERAAADGLLVVLSRLSGLASVPRNEAVSAALADADRYYSAFGFRERRLSGGDRQLYMQMTFQPAAVLALVRQAQLPVWWSRRPAVIAWIVLEENGERRLLAAGDEHPIGEMLRERGRQRGLQISLPVLDLDERILVTPADVWGKVRPTLDEASERYDSDLVLTGRFAVAGTEPLLPDEQGQLFRGEWEVWLDDLPLVHSVRDEPAAATVTTLVDELANRVAERYAVLPRGLRDETLSVTGLNGPADYVAMMRFLGSLEFVEQLDVVGVQGGRLQLRLLSHAPPDQLEMLLTVQDRMRVDALHSGTTTRLIWRG